MDAFAKLGLEPRLTLSQEEIREAFREAGKLAHPDAGGAEEDFSALRAAADLLSSPSRRLKHWLELRGAVPDARGTIDPGLMDLFSIVGTTTQQAETAIRKRDAALSALAKALVENELRLALESVEKAIAAVDGAIDGICSSFPEIEASETPDAERAAKLARDLAFLEKWRAGLRSCYSRLV